MTPTRRAKVLVKLAKRLSPEETVYDFAAWLTAQKKPMTLGSAHDTSVMAEKAAQFINERGLKKEAGWGKSFARALRKLLDKLSPSTTPRPLSTS